MNKAKWLLAAGLVALTAGCVQETYTPSTAYVQPAPTYYAQPSSTYYAQPSSTYYAQPSSTYYVQPTSTYYAKPTTSSSQRYWNSSRADADHDGVPNRYDRDANGDRIPDRYQGR